MDTPFRERFPGNSDPASKREWLFSVWFSPDQRTQWLYLPGHHLVLSTSGAFWTARRVPATFKTPPAMNWYRGDSLMAPHGRLLAWGLGLRFRGKAPGRVVRARIPARDRARTVRLRVPIGPLASVRYVAFPAHTMPLAAFHRIVRRVLNRALLVWGWTPQQLELSFFCRECFWGISYLQQQVVGAISSPAPRRVELLALHTTLLAQATTESAERVLLHELCHFYREETHPRVLLDQEPHDTLFYELLAQVDPTTPRSIEGGVDTGITWKPEVLEARRRRRERAHARAVWWPTHGTWEVALGQEGLPYLGWVSTARRWPLFLEPFTDDTLCFYLSKLRPEDYATVRVTNAGLPPPADLGTLEELLRALLSGRHSALSLPTTCALLRERRPDLLAPRTEWRLTGLADTPASSQGPS